MVHKRLALLRYPISSSHLAPHHDVGDGVAVRPSDGLHTRTLRKVPHLTHNSGGGGNDRQAGQTGPRLGE